MGNLLDPINSDYLLSEVQPPLDIFSNCIFYIGKFNEIMQIQNRIAKLVTFKGFYLSIVKALRIFKNSPLDNYEDLLEKFFMQSHKKVNIMEVMAGLITYSSCSISEKAKLALNIFDFNNDKLISREEMIIMCMAFIRGIGIMTQNSSFHQKNIQKLADEAFYLADENPDGMITLEE